MIHSEKELQIIRVIHFWTEKIILNQFLRTKLTKKHSMWNRIIWYACWICECRFMCIDCQLVYACYLRLSLELFWELFFVHSIWMTMNSYRCAVWLNWSNITVSSFEWTSMEWARCSAWGLLCTSTTLECIWQGNFSFSFLSDFE